MVSQSSHSGVNSGLSGVIGGVTSGHRDVKFTTDSSLFREILLKTVILVFLLDFSENHQETRILVFLSLLSVG